MPEHYESATTLYRSNVWRWRFVFAAVAAVLFGTPASPAAAQSGIPLGANVGFPDIYDPAMESAFNTNFPKLVALMGVTPQLIGGSVDSRIPISQWVANAAEQALSNAGTPLAQNLIEVLGVPMFSSATGAGTPDQQFRAFAAGQYDSVINGIVQVWAQNGFTFLVIRLGWEMNLPGGSYYAGATAAAQKDWVTAFQHLYTVFHAAGIKYGADIQVMWNPGSTNYSPAKATANMYPGNNFVDLIGVDAYADMYPYADTSKPTYHNWDTGGEVTSIAQFIADPVNRVHYWNYPAANEYVLDASGGYSQSINSVIQFALQMGKPFAVPECGAGNSAGGHDVADDPQFPQWLAGELAAAQAQGLQVMFVAPWDNDTAGNYEFSDGSKPHEAAAWAQYFGAASGQ